MKKYFLVILGFILMFFVACGKLEKQTNLSNLETMVASELEQINQNSPAGNLSDETLKALSVTIRTNLKINQASQAKTNASERFVNIAKQTEGQVLKNKNGNLVETSLENNEDYAWQKSIKKSELLEFASKNNISLTSLASTKPVTENGRVVGLRVGGKYFNYETLAKEFNLESNIIEKISENKNEIIINGRNKGFQNHFDLEKSEQLSNDNCNYLQILSEFFSDFNVD